MISARKRPAPKARSTGRARADYMRETHFGGGIEPVPGFDAGRVMMQGFGARPVPARLCTDRLGLASSLEFAFPESIVGKDDRVPVVDTTQLPWRCICQLVMEGLAGEEVLGTGWLAGPGTVLTAGHNLLSAQSGRTATRVTVIPGRQGNLAPFNFFHSTRFDVHPRWRELRDPRFDLGMVQLGSPVGQTTGWFGFGSRSDAELPSLIVNTSGYPGDKRIGTQWFNAGRISAFDGRTLTYGLDTVAGQSGSPIYAVDSKGGRTVLAVHAYGGDDDNRGIRITDDVFDLFQSWLA